MIVAKLDTMHAHEPSLTHDDLGKIACRTLVMVADDDEVRLEHAVDLYRSLPEAELSVVPGTSHGLLVDDNSELCNMVITEFFTKDFRYRYSRPSAAPLPGSRAHPLAVPALGAQAADQKEKAKLCPSGSSAISSDTASIRAR